MDVVRDLLKISTMLFRLWSLSSIDGEKLVSKRNVLVDAKKNARLKSAYLQGVAHWLELLHCLECLLLIEQCLFGYYVF